MSRCFNWTLQRAPNRHASMLKYGQRIGKSQILDQKQWFFFSLTTQSRHFWLQHLKIPIHPLYYQKKFRSILLNRRVMQWETFKLAHIPVILLNQHTLSSFNSHLYNKCIHLPCSQSTNYFILRGKLCKWIRKNEVF